MPGSNLSILLGDGQEKLSCVRPHCGEHHVAVPLSWQRSPPRIGRSLWHACNNFRRLTILEVNSLIEPRLKRRSCQFAFSAAHAMAVSWTEVTFLCQRKIWGQSCAGATQKEHHTTGWQCSGIRQQFGHEAPTNWDRGVSFVEKHHS